MPKDNKIESANKLLKDLEVKYNSQWVLKKQKFQPGKINKISDKLNIFEDQILAVGRHLEDRMVDVESNFSRKGKKQAGVTEGYIAKRDSDGHLFMIKKFYKEPIIVSGQDQRNDNWNSICGVNEFVTAPLYSRILYDRTPIIELVTNRS